MRLTSLSSARLIIMCTSSSVDDLTVFHPESFGIASRFLISFLELWVFFFVVVVIVLVLFCCFSTWKISSFSGIEVAYIYFSHCGMYHCLWFWQCRSFGGFLFFVFLNFSNSYECFLVPDFTLKLKSLPPARVFRNSPCVLFVLCSVVVYIFTLGPFGG